MVISVGTVPMNQHKDRSLQIGSSRFMFGCLDWKIGMMTLGHRVLVVEGRKLETCLFRTQYAELILGTLCHWPIIDILYRKCAGKSHIT